MPLTATLLATAAIVVIIGIGTVVRSEALIVAVLVVWGAIMPFIAVTARPALMGAVPAEKQGQASGVNLSTQMLGGTVAIAIASPLLILTNAYWPIFVLTGIGVAGAAVIAWRMIDNPVATGLSD